VLIARCNSAVAKGHGYARLLKHDPARQAMLQERLGASPAELGLPSNLQIQIICATPRRAWQLPPPASASLPSGADKTRRLAQFIAATWEQLNRPYPSPSSSRRCRSPSFAAAPSTPRPLCWCTATPTPATPSKTSSIGRLLAQGSSSSIQTDWSPNVPTTSPSRCGNGAASCSKGTRRGSVGSAAPAGAPDRRRSPGDLGVGLRRAGVHRAAGHAGGRGAGGTAAAQGRSPLGAAVTCSQAPCHTERQRLRAHRQAA
jgi:hypothetical protein